MHVVLAVPPGYAVPHAQSCLERLGFGYLASPLRAEGHSVTIIDGVLDRLTWSEFLAGVVAAAPDILGVSLMSHHGFDPVVEFLGEARAALPDAHFCLGGMFPSLNAPALLDALPMVDSVASGEGEAALVGLARQLAAGVPIDGVPGLAWRTEAGTYRQLPPWSPEDLDELLDPARDQLPLVLSRSGPAALISSRGCYARCTFCTLEAVTRSLYSRVARYRSPVRLVDEIERLVHDYGARKLYFVDENFMGPGERGRERARQIARQIVSRGIDVKFSLECRCMDVEEETFRELAAAGLQRVFLGVESIDPEELERFRKSQDPAMVERAISILRGLGIHVEIGFILFTPWSSLGSIWRKRLFLEQFGAHATASLGSYLSIMPGTALEGQLRQEGLLRGSWPAYRFEFQDRRASILFGLVQRELTDPWSEPLERILALHWNRPADWSIEHACRRNDDPVLAFAQELITWTSTARLLHFDALLEVVGDLELPRDAENPPERVRDALRGVAEASRRDAADALALVTVLEQLLSHSGAAPLPTIRKEAEDVRSRLSHDPLMHSAGAEHNPADAHDRGVRTRRIARSYSEDRDAAAAR